MPPWPQELTTAKPIWTVAQTEELVPEGDQKPVETTLVLRTTVNAASGNGRLQKFKLSRPKKERPREVPPARSKSEGSRSRARPPLQLLTEPANSSLSLVLRWKAWSKMVCPDERWPYVIGEVSGPSPALFAPALFSAVALGAYQAQAFTHSIQCC